MREKRLDNRKSGWVLLSQIVLVPVYVIFYALSKALDGILFAFGKAMDGVGAFFRRTFLWIKGLFVRGERREKSRPVRRKESRCAPGRGNLPADPQNSHACRIFSHARCAGRLLRRVPGLFRRRMVPQKALSAGGGRPRPKAPRKKEPQGSRRTALEESFPLPYLCGQDRNTQLF